jgi:hypothetical protein
VEDLEQALRNAALAKQAGCPGIFLINHSTDYDSLLEIHHQVYKEFPDWWIGVNCLDLSPVEVFPKVSDEVAGIWVDNARIDERAEATDQHQAEAIMEARERSGWTGIYFGGVAFKYQRAVVDLTRAAQLASRYMEIVTTSGPGTGLAADIQKIRTMKLGLGDSPLAIASGITPENICKYLLHADAFLVATGISSSFTEIDPERLTALMQRVRAIGDVPV